MQPLHKNPKTGFLESNSEQNLTFNSVRKVRFLELAREAVEKKCMPDIPAICKSLDINSRTFYDHKARDENFKAAWEEVINECESTLVQTMYTNAQRPSGYMDRITWLRAYKPGTWNPDLRLSISQDSAALKGVIDSASSVIEATIVPDPKQLPVNCPSSEPK